MPAWGNAAVAQLLQASVIPVYDCWSLGCQHCPGCIHVVTFQSGTVALIVTIVSLGKTHSEEVLICLPIHHRPSIEN